MFFVMYVCMRVFPQHYPNTLSILNPIIITPSSQQQLEQYHHHHHQNLTVQNAREISNAFISIHLFCARDVNEGECVCVCVIVFVCVGALG